MSRERPDAGDVGFAFLLFGVVGGLIGWGLDCKERGIGLGVGIGLALCIAFLTVDEWLEQYFEIRRQK